MKNIIFVCFILICYTSKLNAQCATHTSCDQLIELCVTGTADSISCNYCSHTDSTGLWYKFETKVNNLPININSNWLGRKGYALYGPLATNYDCGNLPIPLDSITDSSFLNITTYAPIPGRYILHVYQLDCPKNYRTITIGIENRAITCASKLDSVECIDCIGSYAPIPGQKYLITAWAREASPPVTKTSYTFPEIYLDFPSSGDTPGPFTPTGVIIDGWQRIEAEFTVPAGASDMKIRLSSSSGDVYFDDIRVLPFDASMKTYAYDPVNMRLVAEMDERHYATFYEYNEEGQLVRIKKETEKGVMTIQETRNNASKQ